MGLFMSGFLTYPLSVYYLRVAECWGAGTPIGSCLLGLRTRDCLQTSTVCRPLSLLLPSSAKPAGPSGHWHAGPPVPSDISLAPAPQKDNVCTARLTLNTGSLLISWDTLKNQLSISSRERVIMSYLGLVMTAPYHCMGSCPAQLPRTFPREGTNLLRPDWTHFHTTLPDCPWRQSYHENRPVPQRNIGFLGLVLLLVVNYTAQSCTCWQGRERVKTWRVCLLGPLPSWQGLEEGEESKGFLPILLAWREMVSYCQSP